MLHYCSATEAASGGRDAEQVTLKLEIEAEEASTLFVHHFIMEDEDWEDLEFPPRLNLLQYAIEKFCSLDHSEATEILQQPLLCWLMNNHVILLYEISKLEHEGRLLLLSIPQPIS
nr:uncharacterized protein LOC108945116 [Nicotiana tomentosiformis]